MLRHSKTGKMETFGTTFLNSCGGTEESSIFSSSREFSLSFEVANVLTSDATVLAAILAYFHARKREKIQVSKERWRRLKWRTQSNCLCLIYLSKTAPLCVGYSRLFYVFIVCNTDKPKCRTQRRCELSQVGKFTVRCLMHRWNVCFHC